MTDNKTTKRKLTNLTFDIFCDQVVTLKRIKNETGISTAALIRQAVDKAYPRKKEE